MLLIDNVSQVRTKFSAAWEMDREGDSLFDDEIKLEQNANNKPILAVQTETGWNYLQSKYDPEGEATRLIAGLQNVEKYKHVFFYGIGLGYHVKAFIRMYPEVKYSLYEPEVSVLKKCMSSTSIDDLITGNLQYFYIENNEHDRNKNLRHFIGRVKEEVLLVILPAYERIFAKKTKEFMNLFSEIIFERRKYNYAALAFSKRTIISGIQNLPFIFRTPNILHEEHESFRGKPAILVAAGPSLDYEYENLRYIKENGLAYIFSVGTAVNALLAKNIYPHGACTYDPSVKNAEVFQRIKDEKIDTIPLIYGSTVGFETIQNYPGPLLHYLVNRDFVNPYYLKRTDGKGLEVVESAESIAIITLQLLYRLGCNPIILVGQNLAFTKERSYAAGSKEDVSVNEKLMEKAIVVKDVEGNDIYTIKGYESFRKEMERHIQVFKDLEVINTTKGGAHIKGTTYIPLETVIAERLKQKDIVDQTWVQKHTVHYDRDFFLNQSNVLMEECKRLEQIFKNFFRLLEQMNDAVIKMKACELQKLFNKFDRAFDKLQANNFYLFFIQVMNHLDFDLVMKTFEEVRFHKDPLEKAKIVLEEFSNYLRNCQADYQLIRPLLDDIPNQVLGVSSERGK